LKATKYKTFIDRHSRAQIWILINHFEEKKEKTMSLTHLPVVNMAKLEMQG
jgi:hypothetical protein